MNLRQLEQKLATQHPDLEQAYRKEFPYEVFAQGIVGARVRCNLTQAELAQKMKTSQSAVARAESGRHPMNVEFLVRVGDALGLDLQVQFTERSGGPAIAAHNGPKKQIASTISTLSPRSAARRS